MIKKKNILFLFWIIVIVACSDSDKKGEENSPYDPSMPIEVLSFTPDSGRVREKVIIKGSNFGTDKSIVQVLFKDEVTERRSTVIGVNNNTIYCLAPRQSTGDNQIIIRVDGRDVQTEKLFRYAASENVSTIAGGAGGDKTDGTLAEANFSYMHGIAALGDEAVLVFQRDNPAVRYISVPDNAVLTIHAGFQAGKPVTNKSKTKVYATQWDTPHTIYMYTKEGAWAPSRIGEIGSAFNGRIRALALDESEEYLYFCDRYGKFGRFEIKTQRVELLAELDINTSGDGGYLIYNHFNQKFYLSVQAAYGIYEIAKNAQGVYEATPYAGFNGNRVTDGYLDECAFAQPNGMTLDEDGNIFIVEGSGSYLVRKISSVDSYVSTIAGKTGTAGGADGIPLFSTFNFPYDIDNDGEGNYFIAEGWGAKVRKYAVE